MQAAIKDTASDASRSRKASSKNASKKPKKIAKRSRHFERASASWPELGGPTEPKGRRPLVFIIDELDRCRPPFALNVLERVKHLFSVENVCFVLVAHLPQLEAVVKGSYGLGVDARTYLEKFFQLQVTLPEPQPVGAKQ